MTNGRGYSYLDIQLMRAFFQTLESNTYLTIQKPLLRAFLPELQEIKSEFQSEFQSEQGMSDRIENYRALTFDEFSNMSPNQIGDALRLRVSNDWGVVIKIAGQTIQALTLVPCKENLKKVRRTQIHQDTRGNLMIKEADGSTSCEDYRIGTKIYKNYRMDKKGVLTADLISYPNGEIRKNWFEDKKGVIKADLISCSNGEKRKNWREDENGVKTCKLRTFPDGKTYKNYKEENGIITYGLMSFPSGEIRKNFRQDERGVQTAEQITYPNGEICENWRKDENGVITYGLITYPNGRKHKNWRIDERGGVQTAEQITYPSGRKYENWSWRQDEKGVQTAEQITYPSGKKYKNWRKDEKGVETYEDENGDRKLVPIQDDGLPAKKRRKVGA